MHLRLLIKEKTKHSGFVVRASVQLRTLLKEASEAVGSAKEKGCAIPGWQYERPRSGRGGESDCEGRHGRRGGRQGGNSH